MQASLDHLMLLADRLSLIGYEPDTWEPHEGDAAAEARLDLDAVQHVIAMMKGEPKARQGE